LQPEDGFIKKPKHVVNMTFNYLLIIFNVTQVVEFYVLLTAHLGIILANDQIDAQNFSYMFIPNFYMFRAAVCSSAGELIVSIRHRVHVILCR
jgi:hypothetical protein